MTWQVAVDAAMAEAARTQGEAVAAAGWSGVVEVAEGCSKAATP